MALDDPICVRYTCRDDNIVIARCARLAYPASKAMSHMGRSLRLLVIVLFLLSPIHASAVAETIQLFTTETKAQKHCPADVVVWVNTPTGIYHFKGMRWYGNTNHGAYVCKNEGDAAGYRATRNGQ